MGGGGWLMEGCVLIRMNTVLPCYLWPSGSCYIKSPGVMSYYTPYVFNTLYFEQINLEIYGMGKH